MVVEKYITSSNFTHIVGDEIDVVYVNFPEHALNVMLEFPLS